MVSHLAELRDPQAFRSWLVAIAIRQVRDRHHSQKLSLTRHARLDDADDVTDVAGDFVDVTIIRLGLSDQRKEVAEEDRELLSLWWLEETGAVARRDLAHALQLSAPHAAVRVARMKEQVETGRAIVRAMQTRPGCANLYGIAREWDGAPSPLWRKRFGRHVRECEVCAPRLWVKPIQTARGTVGRARPLHRIFAGWHGALVAGCVMAAVTVGAVAVAISGHADSRPIAALPTNAAAASLPSASPSPSATPSPSRSPLPSPRPTASTHPAVVPAKPASSSRKGVCVWTFTGVDKALSQSSGASWYYTWSTNHNGVSALKGVEFVPMIWGPDSVPSSALKQAKAAGHELLGFNEPDLSAQSNMTVSKALDLWPQLMSTGLTLGSPAVASGGATAGGWLDSVIRGLPCPPRTAGRARACSTAGPW